jgi:uncharacterized repeat protein (TIGR01451 family)
MLQFGLLARMLRIFLRVLLYQLPRRMMQRSRAIGHRRNRRQNVGEPQPQAFHHFWKTHRRHLKFLLMAFMAFIFTLQTTGVNLWLTAPVAAQSGSLYIEPLTWDFVGLDSNNVNDGPNEFLAGARVCNIGSATLNNISVKFVKTGATNPYITVTALGDASRTDTINIASLSPGSTPLNHHQVANKPANCFDAYYNVIVERTTAAHNTVQKYYIRASSATGGSVTTPANRQLYVEKVLSQGRNEIVSFSGPTSVTVGETYTYTLVSKTATAYPQLTISSDFPNAVFRFEDISTSYTNPSGAKNSSIYADACGWIADYTAAGYHTSSSNCDGSVPDQYSGGKVGDTVTTTYKIKILSTGSGASTNTLTVNHLILDFSGGSYHYNADTSSKPFEITVYDPKADLSIDKSHTGNFSTGVNTYNLTVRNNGPDTAKAPITITDTLPTGYSYNSVDSTSSNGWSCSSAGQTVTCSNTNDLALNATSTLKLNVTVGASALTSSVNTATASSSTTDPISTNNTDTDPTIIVTGANLKLTKSDGNSTANQPTLTVGQQQATYTFTVQNQSPTTVAAKPIVVTDTLPAGLSATCSSFTSAGGDWTCAVDGSNFTFTRNTDLGTSQSTSFSLVANTDSSAIASGQSSAVVTNTATVNSSTYDPSPGDNTSSDTLTLSKPVPDLTITKSHIDPFVKDSNGLYTIKVTNNGVASTTGTITITETLPSALGMSYQSHSGLAPSGSTLTWSCSNSSNSTCVANNTGTLTFTTSQVLAPAQSATLYLTAKPTTVSSTAVNNTVTVSTPGDGTTQTKTVNDPTTIVAVPANNASISLSVLKQQWNPSGNGSVYTSPQSVTPGGSLQYAITVTNTQNSGPDATTFSLSDTIPSEITVTSWSCTVLDSGVAGQGATTGCSPTSASGTSITDVNPSITLRKNGGSVRIIVVSTVKSSSALGTATSITNTASIPTQVGSDRDPTPIDNISTLVNPITRTTDLGITKTDGGIDFVAGTSGTYTLTVTNTSAGPTFAPITVTDDLPDSFTFISGSSASGSSGWICELTNSATKVVTCTNNNVLAAGAQSQIQIVATPTTATGSPFTNTATVSTTGDATSSNNKATDTTNVGSANVDLAITKSNPSGTNFVVGQSAAYQITVTNRGPTAAPASAGSPIRVTDTLPTALSYASASGAGWSCSASGQVVTCDRTSSLGVNSSSTITLNVFVDAGAPTSINNTAQVAQHANEPANVFVTNDNNSTSRNIHTISTTIDQKTDLSVSKTLSGSLVAGQNATYQLTVTNNGPATVSSTVTVQDTLPTGLTFVSGSGGEFTCSAGTPVTCTKSDGLTLGQTATVNLTVAVASNASGNLTNAATVSSAVTDINSSNNSASVTSAVTSAVKSLSLSKSHAGNFPLNGQGTYTLQLTNTGNVAITDQLKIVDTLPTQLSYASVVGQGWSCSGTTTVTCTTDDDLAVNSSNAIDLVVNVAANTPVGTNSITNSASVFLGSNTTATATATDPTTIIDSADLSVTKTATSGFAQGQQATYQIVVRNNSTSSVPADITLTDQLPTGLSYVSGSGTNWTCPASSTSSDITCTYKSAIAANSDAEPLTITVLVGSGSSFTNFATVYSATPDPNTANNTDLESTTVSNAQVLLVKRITAINGKRNENPNDTTIVLNAFVNDTTSSRAADDDHDHWPSGYLKGAINAGKVKPNDTIEYTIYFLNPGGRNANDVKICDRLSPNLSFETGAYGGTGKDLQIEIGNNAAQDLTSANDTSDRAQLYAANATVPSTCNLKAENTNGTVAVDVTGATGTGIPNLTTLTGSTGSGKPTTSYGLIRFTTRVP